MAREWPALPAGPRTGRAGGAWAERGSTPARRGAPRSLQKHVDHADALALVQMRWMMMVMTKTMKRIRNDKNRGRLMPDVHQKPSGPGTGTPELLMEVNDTMPAIRARRAFARANATSRDPALKGTSEGVRTAGNRNQGD